MNQTHCAQAHIHTQNNHTHMFTDVGCYKNIGPDDEV